VFPAALSSLACQKFFNGQKQFQISIQVLPSIIGTSDSGRSKGTPFPPVATQQITHFLIEFLGHSSLFGQGTALANWKVGGSFSRWREPLWRECLRFLEMHASHFVHISSTNAQVWSVLKFVDLWSWICGRKGMTSYLFFLVHQTPDTEKRLWSVPSLRC
jgi:hypothetical protein